MKKGSLPNLNEQNKLSELTTGILGIYSCYWFSGYLQQKILKVPYPSNSSGQSALFQNPISIIWTQAIVSWLIGFIINKKFYMPSTELPAKKMMICAFLVMISALSSILAIKITSFPVVMMIKSCSIIPVVLVGVCCSRVKDKSLKLGTQKIIIALLISIGILLYNFGADSQSNQQSTSLTGIFLMMISIIADGFLPDVQTVIKAQCNPRPIEMFEQTNKWVALISLVYAGVTGSLSYLFWFCLEHPEILRDLIILSLLSGLGQIFVYRMVREFKQHVVPLVITTRKIFTVVISIVVYKHETTKIQVVGISLVFLAAVYEYIEEAVWGRDIKLRRTDLVKESERGIEGDLIEGRGTLRMDVFLGEGNRGSKEKLETI